jgi:hypothetical protein
MLSASKTSWAPGAGEVPYHSTLPEVGKSPAALKYSAT